MRSIDLAPYKVRNPLAADGEGLKDLEAIQKLYKKLVASADEKVNGELDALLRVINDLKANSAADIDYDVRNSLIEVLFAPNQGLSARDILDRDDLARKIRDWPDATLLLEDTEYDKVKQALESVTGFGRNDVEFVRRIFQASKVEVKGKAKEDASKE